MAEYDALGSAYRESQTDISLGDSDFDELSNVATEFYKAGPSEPAPAPEAPITPEAPAKAPAAARVKPPEPTQELTPGQKAASQVSGERAIEKADAALSLPYSPTDVEATVVSPTGGFPTTFEAPKAEAEIYPGHLGQGLFESGSIAAQLSYEKARDIIMAGGTVGSRLRARSVHKTLMDEALHAYHGEAAEGVDDPALTQQKVDKFLTLTAMHDIAMDMDLAGQDFESMSGSAKAIFDQRVEARKKELNKELESGTYEATGIIEKTSRYAFDALYGAYDPFFYSGRIPEGIATSFTTWGLGKAGKPIISAFAPKAGVWWGSMANWESVISAGIEGAVLSPKFTEWATMHPEYADVLALGELGTSVVFGVGSEWGMTKAMDVTRKYFLTSPKLAELDPVQIAARITQANALHKLLTTDITDPQLLSWDPETLTTLWNGPSWGPRVPDRDHALMFTAAYSHLMPYENATRIPLADIPIRTESQDFVPGISATPAEELEAKNARALTANTQFIRKAKSKTRELLYGSTNYEVTLATFTKDLDEKLFTSPESIYTRANKFLAEHPHADLADVNTQAAMLAACDPDGWLRTHPGILRNFNELEALLFNNIDPKLRILKRPDPAAKAELLDILATDSTNQLFEDLEKVLLPGVMHVQGITAAKPEGVMAAAMLREAKSMENQARLYYANLESGGIEGIDPEFKKFLDTNAENFSGIGFSSKDFEELALQRVQAEALAIAGSVKRIGITNAGQIALNPGSDVPNQINVEFEPYLRAAAYIVEAQQQAHKVNIPSLAKVTATTPTSIGVGTSPAEIRKAVDQLLLRLENNTIPVKVDNPILQLSYLFDLQKPKANIEVKVYDPENIVRQKIGQLPYNQRKNITFPSEFGSLAEDLKANPNKVMTAGTRYNRKTTLDSALTQIRETGKAPIHIQEAAARLAKTGGARVDAIEHLEDSVSNPDLFQKVLDTLQNRSKTDPSRRVSNDDVLDIIDARLRRASGTEAVELERLRAGILQAEDQLQARGGQAAGQLDSDDIDYDASIDSAANMSYEYEDVFAALDGPNKAKYEEIRESLVASNIAKADIVDFLDEALVRADDLADDFTTTSDYPDLISSGAAKTETNAYRQMLRQLRDEVEQAPTTPATFDPKQRVQDEDKVLNWFARETQSGEGPMSLRDMTRSMTKTQMRQQADTAQKERKRAFASLNAAINTLKVDQATKDLLHNYKDTQWNTLTQQHPDWSTQDKIRMIKSRLAANVGQVMSNPGLSLRANMRKLGFSKEQQIEILEQLKSQDTGIRTEAWQNLMEALKTAEPGPKATPEQQREYQDLLEDFNRISTARATGTDGYKDAIGSMPLQDESVLPIKNPEALKQSVPSIIGSTAEDQFVTSTTEIKGMDDVHTALLQYNRILQTPTDYDEPLIQAIQNNDFSRVTPEQANIANAVKTMEAEVVKRLQRFTNTTESNLDALLKDERVQTLLKANAWLQAETRTFAGMPQEQNLINAAIALRDKVNNTNVLQNASLVTTKQYLKTVDDAVANVFFDLDEITMAWTQGEGGQIVANATARKQVDNYLQWIGLDHDSYSQYLSGVSVQMNKDGLLEIDTPEQLTEILHDTGNNPFARGLSEVEIEPEDPFITDNRAARLTQIKAHVYQEIGLEPTTLGIESSNVFITKPLEPTDLISLARQQYGAYPALRPTQLALARLELGVDKFAVDDRAAMGLLDMRKQVMGQISEQAVKIRQLLHATHAESPNAAMRISKTNLALVDLVMFRRRTLMFKAYEDTLKKGRIDDKTLLRLKDLELSIGPNFDTSLAKAIDAVAPGSLDIPTLDRPNIGAGTVANPPALSEVEATDQLLAQITRSTMEFDQHFIETLDDVRDKPKALANALSLYNDAIITQMTEAAKIRKAKRLELERVQRALDYAEDGVPSPVTNITDQVSAAEKEQMVRRAELDKAKQTTIDDLKPGKKASNPEYDRATVAPDSDVEADVRRQRGERAKQDTKAAREAYKAEVLKNKVDTEQARLDAARKRLGK